MIYNNVLKIMAFMLAVVLLTSAHESIGTTHCEPVMLVDGENNETQETENDGLRPNLAIVPESTHISRSRVKRLIHRFNLGQQRRRSAFKRALRRLFSLGHLREETKGSGVWILDKRSTLRRSFDNLAHRVLNIKNGFAVRRIVKEYNATQKTQTSREAGINAPLASVALTTTENAPQSIEPMTCGTCFDVTGEVDLTLENGPQCIECFLDETEALTHAPDSIDKYADCEPVDGLLSDLNPDLVEYGNATLRRTFCAVAVIALMSAFMPQEMAFSLSFIGAVRTPKPEWLKQVENSGVLVASKGAMSEIKGRKENTRTKKCAQCLEIIPAGVYFAQLEAVNAQGIPYTSLKPHCEVCSVEYVRRESTHGKTTTSPVSGASAGHASASVSEPEPQSITQVSTVTLRPNTFRGWCAICEVEVGPKAGFVHADSPKGSKIRCANHATEALFIGSNGKPIHGKKANGATAEPPQGLSQAIKAQVSASLPSTTQGDKIELLQALLSGDGLNEEQVRSVALAVVEQYAENAIQTGVSNASAQVEDRIQKVVDELKAQEPIKTLHLKPSKKGKAVKIEGAYHPAVPTVFGILKAGLQNGTPLPVYLVGEAGTGKSYAVAQIQAMLQAAKLQSSASYGEIICFADMTRGDLLGNIRYGVGGKGSIEWQRSGLVKPLLEGGVAFVDEIDKADPAVLVLLNGVLASRTIIDPATGEVLKIHPQAVIIAAGNTAGFSMGGAYKAAQVQDASLLDRFAGTVVKFGFSARIAASIMGLSHSMAEPENSPRGEPAQMSEVLKSYTELRGIVAGKTPIQFSNRALLHASILAKDGWTLNALIGRWIEPLDSELRREVLNHFSMADGDNISLIPQGVFEPESVDIAGGA